MSAANKPSQPGAIDVAGERHVATVLHVIERDEQGRPTTCRILRDDESIKIEGGEQFLVVYALASSLDPVAELRRQQAVAEKLAATSAARKRRAN